MSIQSWAVAGAVFLSSSAWAVQPGVSRVAPIGSPEQQSALNPAPASPKPSEADATPAIVEALNEAQRKSNQPPPQQIDPKMSDMQLQAQKLMTNPLVRAYINFLTRPDVIEHIKTVALHPEKKNVLYWWICALLAFLMFRSWRHNQVDHWLQKFWISLYSGFVFWIVSVFVIPSAVLGKPYQELLRLSIQEIRTRFEQTESNPPPAPEPSP